MRATKYVFLLSAIAALPSVLAESHSAWRVWTTEDGLAESYTRKVSIGVDGRVILRHGAVPNASILDGYSVAQIPEARTAPDIDWGRLARIYASRNGELWTVEEGVLKRFSDRRWRTEAVGSPGDY